MSVWAIKKTLTSFLERTMRGKPTNSYSENINAYIF